MSVAFDIGLLPDRPIDELARLAASAEEKCFEGVWIADSQSIFRDAYAALTICALRTERMLLATGVTNPLTRHPAVLAGVIATVDEISGGRAILGIGTGESAVKTIGRKASTLREMEEAILAIRSLLAGESTEYQGTTLKMSWPTRCVPIYVAASGPKTLQLAGRIADGVLFQVGASPVLVEYALNEIRKGAEQAGRSYEEIQLCMRLACNLSSNGEEARRELRPYAAAAAVTTFRSVPASIISDEIGQDIRRLRERYDYHKHTNVDAGHQELVTSTILDAVAIAGTPEEALPKFKKIAGMGIHRIVIPLTGSDPDGVMKVLAEEIRPHLSKSGS
jgi:5,10-methylenetetrahydromethanopterin reductase